MYTLEPLFKGHIVNSKCYRGGFTISRLHHDWQSMLTNTNAMLVLELN